MRLKTVSVLSLIVMSLLTFPLIVQMTTVAIEDNQAGPNVADPSVNLLVIPDDTDNDPRWGEIAALKVNVTDESGIGIVTINLSDQGWEVSEMANQSRCQQYGLCDPSVAVMFCIGNYSADSTIWVPFNFSTNASNGITSWNGTAYEPFCLPINATNVHGNANTSVCINLIVMKNGDVNENGVLNFGDVTYLANHMVDTSGYESMQDSVGEVNGDSIVNFGDVTYLANHVVGTSGYAPLK